MLYTINKVLIIVKWQDLETMKWQEEQFRTVQALAEFLRMHTEIGKWVAYVPKDRRMKGR